MAEARSPGPVVPSILASGPTINFMDLEHTCGQMANLTKANGVTIQWTELACSNLLMARPNI